MPSTKITLHHGVLEEGYNPIIGEDELLITGFAHWHPPKILDKRIIITAWVVQSSYDKYNIDSAIRCASCMAELPSVERIKVNNIEGYRLRITDNAKEFIENIENNLGKAFTFEYELLW